MGLELITCMGVWTPTLARGSILAMTGADKGGASAAEGSGVPIRTGIWTVIGTWSSPYMGGAGETEP
jgi:hypothetical protein